jgi:hypothetical protein
VKNNKISGERHVCEALLEELLVDDFGCLVQDLGGVELNAVLLEVLLLEPGQHQPVLALAPLGLQRVAGQHHLLLVLHQQAAQRAAPLHHPLLRLHEDYLQRVLADRVLAHRHEHPQRPRELLAVALVERTVLLQVLVEGVEYCSEVCSLLSAAISVLNEKVITL